jgi:hypothetical protein
VDALPEQQAEETTDPDCDDRTESLMRSLEEFLGHLPRPTRLVVYADAEGRWSEREAINLGQMLGDTFDNISFEHRPRRPNYDFWPVIAVMGLEVDEEIDLGLRIIGLPVGVQITSLVGAIQAMAFRGQQLEPLTRIRLAKLPAKVDIELVTHGGDETGAVMAGRCFSFAAASDKIRTFLIMADDFPTVLDRHGVHEMPHAVLNNNVHIEGEIDEDGLLRHLAKAAGR